MSSASEEETPPSATLYINGIDEQIKIPALKAGIKDVFEVAGEIVEIVAKKNLKARGQAFVIFGSVEDAQDAMDALQGFDLFGKPMNLQFAKTRSDVTVLKEDGEEGLEVHKRGRIAEKERKQAIEAAAAAQTAAKRAAADALAERPAKSAKPAASGGAVPDEYLPPNKILFLRELPEDYGKEAIAAVFGRYPGFKEARMVPGRSGIAFVEYEDEGAAISAKEQTSGIVLGEKAVRVTYQRQ